MTTRILHIIGGLSRGGIETWLMHILRNIDRREYQMDFMVSSNAPGHYDEEACALGARILRCVAPRTPWRFTPSFLKLLQANGPYDIVHSHSYMHNGFILRLAKQAGVNTRLAHIYPHVDPKGQRFLRSFYRWLMGRWIAENATIILADSKHSLDAFRSICRCSHIRSEVIYVGIDLAPFLRTVDRTSIRQQLSLPTDKPLVSYVARFAEHKNHVQIIRIADRIANDSEEDIHFVIAGSHGPTLACIKEKVNKRPNISLLVGLDDISDLMLASNLFFFPSLNEGFGIVAVEASAAGIPVVATNLPTISEAYAPGCRAFAFPPNDDDAAIKSIMTILTNQDLLKNLSVEGKEWTKRFSIQHSVKHLLSIYEQITPTI